MTNSRILVWLLLLAAPAWGRSRQKTERKTPPADPGYVHALATADHFLHDWQTGDLENGVVLLSDGIRHSQGVEKLEAFFSSGGSNRAYQIGAGRGNHGRYRFPIVLLMPKENHVVRKTAEIIMINTGRNDWVVDQLP